MGAWFAAGDIVFDETVVDGIDNSVDAFLGMLRGENTGKMVVKTSVTDSAQAAN
jgi:NADPH-dependent curcumin reductase CurA